MRSRAGSRILRDPLSRFARGRTGKLRHPAPHRRVPRRLALPTRVTHVRTRTQEDGFQSGNLAVRSRWRSGGCGAFVERLCSRRTSPVCHRQLRPPHRPKPTDLSPVARSLAEGDGERCRDGRGGVRSRPCRPCRIGRMKAVGGGSPAAARAATARGGASGRSREHRGSRVGSGMGRRLGTCVEFAGRVA